MPLSDGTVQGTMSCFAELERINERPDVFVGYTAEELWSDPHVSKQMLAYHLDGDVSLASRTSAFISRSLAWLTTFAEISAGTRVVDLGCGPGLYTNPLAALGAEVVGVDFSPRSLRHARATAPDTEPAPAYIRGNYLDVDIPGSFDLALMVMCDYCVLSPQQRRRLLDRVSSLLRSDGRFIFDVNGLRAMRERSESVTYAPNLMDGFWSAEPYHGFLHTFVYEPERVSLDKYEIIEAARRRTIYNWYQYFDATLIQTELDQSGFAIDALFGDLTGSDLPPEPSEFCVVAKLGG